MRINPLTAIDFYKAAHIRQYPSGTTQVYSNFTARSAKHSNLLSEYYDNKIVFFGLQYFIQSFLVDCWNELFFQKPKSEVINYYKRRMDYALGKDAIGVKHIEALHDLGYLPLLIKALPEGERIPIGVPFLTIVNTHPDFFWLTNYIETILSCYLWKAITSATIAFEYRKILTRYAIETGANDDFTKYQGHDFSFRGMSGLEDAALSGAAHLLSFVGTDTVPAIDLLEHYYGANVQDDLIGCSVPATEHSVMCMGGEDNEISTFRRLIKKIHPNGIVSIVSDSWDFWKVISVYLPILKHDIMSRAGKVVIRPDSGDPVKIICGNTDAPKGTAESKGAIECLWELFGGTINAHGYKELDPHIGLIYGDSITLDRADKILKYLSLKGFSSANVVLGIGSYTYQYTTRDTFGLAIKATSGIVKNKRRDIFKNPKTDNGSKKSAKGLLRVELEYDEEYKLYENQTVEQEAQGELKLVYIDGTMEKKCNINEIRNKIEFSIHDFVYRFIYLGEKNK